jgi:hypothetical protein
MRAYGYLDALTVGTQAGLPVNESRKTINRAATAPHHNLEYYCRDLNSWPRSSMGLEKDLPPGEQLLALFRPDCGPPSVSGSGVTASLAPSADAEGN